MAVDPKARFRWRALFENVPTSVWLVTLLHALLLLTYSLIVPIWHAADEHQHIDLIRTVRAEFRYPDYDEAMVSQQVDEARALTRRQELFIHLEAEDALPRDGRPSLSDIAADGPSEIRNQLANHPPLYYAVMGGVTKVLGVPGNDWAFDSFVGVYRFLTLLFTVPLPLLAFAGATRIGAMRPVAVAAALIPFAIPQLTHIGSAVNNDNLLTFLFAVMTVLLVYVWTGDTSKATGVKVGAIGGLALLTKGFALVLPLWIASAYTLAAARGVRRTALSAGAIALLLALGIGGWWWVRNVVEFGTVQPGIRLHPDASAGFDPYPWWWVRRFVWQMDWSFWGVFGLHQAKLPHAVALAGTAFMLGGFVLSFAAAPARRFRWGESALLALPVAAIASIVVFGAYRGYVHTAVAGGIQGRYLFPGVVALGIAAAMGLGVLMRRRAGLLPLAIFGAAILMHLLATRIMVATFWGPREGSIAAHVDSVLAWSPWPEPIVIALWILLVVVGAAIALVLWRGARTTYI